MATEKLVDVASNLIARAGERVTCEGDKPGSPTTRRIFSEAVGTWLPVIVAIAQVAGMTHKATSERRLKRFDPETWELLGRGEELSEIARVALLRACLELQARHGYGTDGFVEQLSGAVRDAAATVAENLRAAGDGEQG
jgi:hypothetical protein